MICHNASTMNDYKGPGILNPHPFPGADQISCTTCHGGDGQGLDAESSHVPPPPEIGDEDNIANNALAFFNRLTLTGIDQFADYTVDGKTYSALDYLQFVNPGDLRVVDTGRSCGLCHADHAKTVSNGLLGTATGIFSGATFAIGADNAIPAHQGLFEDTAADLAFRAVDDPDYVPNVNNVGAVGELLEFPVFSAFGDTSPDAIHNNGLYDAANLSLDRQANNQVITDSPLANLYHEQVAFTCGDCHLGSAGANNRYGDFRSSGCTACHMPYAKDGRFAGLDPNVNRTEPADPDNIKAPERPHVVSHRIASVAHTTPTGESIEGINDYACAGCHQGSNRTVMQYWGIRLDQNEDLRKGFQYPLNPVSYQDTRNDPRLFDPVVDNDTFNGRRDRQYIVFEDYDGDGRDDTPEDVHYAAGMGCIDCHGSFDLHGGDVAAGESPIGSRMEHGVAIGCESCHGSVSAYAQTTPGTDYDGNAADLAVDGQGNALPHVARSASGDYLLTSRLTGAVHYVPQTRDTVVDTGAVHAFDGQPVYSDMASYAMGRDDGDDATGLGPQQNTMASGGFSHSDRMDCASCHSSWSNTCSGCHLQGEYTNNQNTFSNITGERIVFRERNADFVYQSPVPFQLGVSAANRISTMSTNTKMFFQYRDKQGDDSDIFAFSDRNGAGNNPSNGAAALSHNAMMAHSIRGRVEATNEGPRYCVACHLTDDGLTSFGPANYDAFVNDMALGNYGALDYDMLATHIGANPGNQLNSPVWVHMVAGLGSGLFLFDETGAPVNPLDTNANRAGAGGVAPASITFDPSNAAFDMDRIVEANGNSNASDNHPMLAPGVGPNLRDGSQNPNLEGPLGATLIRKLTDRQNGVVLDSWIDADGQPQGDAGTVVGGP